MQDTNIEPVLEAILVNQNEGMDEMNKNLEAIIVQNEENKLEPILENMIIQNDESQKILTDINNNIKEKNVTPKIEIEIDGATLEVVEGAKGDKGDTGPEPTDEKLISLIEPLIPEPKNGKDGKDGVSVDKKEVVSDILDIVLQEIPTVEEIVSQIPIPKDGLNGKDANENEIIKTVLEIIPKPKNGTNGKDGSPDTGKEIVGKLRKLKKGERLSYEDLDDTPTIFKGSSKTTSLSELDDVNLSGLAQTNGKYDLASGSSQNLQEVTAQGATTNIASSFTGGLNTNNLEVIGSSATSNLFVTNNNTTNSIALASLRAPSATGDTYFAVGRALTNTNSTLIGHSTTSSATPYAFMTTYGRPASDFAILANGNVGIGVLNSTRRFAVNGNAIVGSGLSEVNFTIDGFNGDFNFTDGSRFETTRSTLFIHLDNSSANINFQNGKVFFAGSGNVGIGTTSPLQRLHVNGSALFGSNVGVATATPINVSFGGTYGTNAAGSQANLKWDLYNQSGVNRYGIGMSAGLMEFQAGSQNDGNYAWFTGNSTERMRLTTAGNLGIGTTSPSARLHIISTTEQFRVGHDASNFFSTTVGSTGSTTFALTGTAPVFTFSQEVRNTVAGTNSASTVTVGGTQTLTNKRVSKRVVVTTQSATPTINTNNGDIFQITGLAQAITSFTTNLTGTPVAGDELIIEITDNGTARAITWGASFEASTVSLPTITLASILLTVKFRWNTTTSKWRCVSAV